MAPQRNVGDFDASGADIERDWSRARTAGTTWRVLLTHDQVRGYELPPAVGKAGDPRWPAFADRYGLESTQPVQWKVEALDPAELQRLVLAAVAPYVDRAVLTERIAEEERQRGQLRAFLEGWPSRSHNRNGDGSANDESS